MLKFWTMNGCIYSYELTMDKCKYKCRIYDKNKITTPTNHPNKAYKHGFYH